MKYGLFLIFLVTLISCRKDESIIIDYRSDYTGHYDFEIVNWTFGGVGGQNSSSSSFHFGEIRAATMEDFSDCQICWVEEDIDSCLTVYYAPGRKAVVKLAFNGKLDHFSYYSPSSKFIYNDSIYIYYVETSSLGAGGYGFNVYGKKQ